MTATILPFARPSRAAPPRRSEHKREIVVTKTKIQGQNWKRPRWVVLVIFGDGSCEWRQGLADRATAEFLGQILAQKYGYPVRFMDSASQGRPQWALRVIAALEHAGLAESGLERIVGKSRRWIERWLSGARVRASLETAALIAVSEASGVSMHWIATGEIPNALRMKSILARMRELASPNPVVDLEEARELFRPRDRLRMTARHSDTRE